MAWGSVQAAVAQVNPQLAGTSAVGVEDSPQGLQPNADNRRFHFRRLSREGCKAQGLYVAMTVSTEIALAADLQQQGIHSRDM